MVIALFEHRLRLRHRHCRVGAGLRAHGQPGVSDAGIRLDFNGYADQDGSGLVVVRFESEAAMQTLASSPGAHQDPGQGSGRLLRVSTSMTVASPVIREYFWSR